MDGTSGALEAEYYELLRTHGVANRVGPLSDADIAAILPRIEQQARRTAEIYGTPNQLERFMQSPAAAATGSAGAGYDEITKEIRNALDELGFSLPGPVYVGEYPHQSVNAQAVRTPSGTLLLINTGLSYLFWETTLALGANTLTFGRAPDGAVRVEKQTAAMRQHAMQARRSLAGSLATYILYTDSRIGAKQQIDTTTRGALSYLLARSVDTFAVAHEFGHFLAGHLDSSAGTGSENWLRKTRDQEFEADQIGALLALRARLNFSEALTTNIAVAGPFLFFAIDHMVNRIRAEIPELASNIVSDHPPSDTRAAALRQTLTELEGPDVFQFADAFVQCLSWMEDDIVTKVHELLIASR